MKLLPEPARTSTYTLYAWLRAADDLGDSEHAPADRQAQLEQFLVTTRVVFARADGPLPPAADTPLWRAMRAVVARHRIPLADLEGTIQGQLDDQRIRAYATLEELDRYCHRVASLVGLMCLRIWGFEETPHTRELAEWRGLALQLTNILRDVPEDARRGRVYLPAELFARPPASAAELLAGERAPVLAAMRALAARAAHFFTASAPLADHVDAGARACLFAMTTHYRTLLARIERDPERVLSGERVRLGRLTKVGIVLRALARKPALARRSWLARP
jgi:phytoene synthase